MKKLNKLALLFAWLLSFTLVQAADYIVVVDASQSMRGFIKIADKRGKLKPRQKIGLVKTQLVQYLEQIPVGNSRVYIRYFTVNGKEEAAEFIFNAANKKEAIDQANKFDEIVPGVAAGKNGNTHLWSEFHKALEFAEDNKYYLPADKKTGAPEILPNILLLSDGADEQKGAGKWYYEAPRFNPNNKQTVLSAHPWLPQQKLAVWFQLGINLNVGWKGKIVPAGIGQHVQIPLNSPNFSIGGMAQRKFLPGTKINIAWAKVGDQIDMNAIGDKRFIRYEWLWKIDGGKFGVPAEGKGQKGERHNLKFDKPGFYIIKLIGITKDGPREDIAKEENIHIVPPPHNIVIKPAFQLIIGSKPVDNNAVIWTFGNKLDVDIINHTAAEKNDKRMQGKELANLIYKWNFIGNAAAKQNPGTIPFPVGKHQINLTVKEAGKPAHAKEAIPLTFTIKKVEFKVGIANANPDENFEAEMGQEIKFQADLILGPAGIKYMWNFGDGSISNEQNPVYPYQKASPAGKPYQVEVEITLPNGEVIPLSLADTVQVTALSAKATATPANPWPGQVVSFTTPAKDVEKVTWIIDGDRINGDPDMNFAHQHKFSTPGKQTVKVEIKRKNIDAPLKVELNVMVKDVKPAVVVINTAPFIGQPIALNIINAAAAKGAVQFPPGFQTELTDGKGNKLDPKKLFFVEPGPQVIKAKVSWGGLDFESVPAKVDVRGIKIDIGVTPPKK